MSHGLNLSRGSNSFNSSSDPVIIIIIINISIQLLQMSDKQISDTQS